MPTGKVPAKRAPKLSSRQRKILTGEWDADGPMDEDLARKLASALLGTTKPSSEDDVTELSDFEES